MMMLAMMTMSLNLFAALNSDAIKTEASSVNQSLQILMARQQIRLDKIQKLKVYMQNVKDEFIQRGCADNQQMIASLSENILNLKKDLVDIKKEKHPHLQEMVSGMNLLEASLEKSLASCQDIPTNIAHIKEGIHGVKKFLIYIDDINTPVAK